MRLVQDSRERILSLAARSTFSSASLTAATLATSRRRSLAIAAGTTRRRTLTIAAGTAARSALWRSHRVDLLNLLLGEFKFSLHGGHADEHSARSHSAARATRSATLAAAGAALGQRKRRRAEEEKARKGISQG